MEITARDLRIGNLIFDHECEPHYFEVEQISKYVGSELWIAYRKGSIKTKTAEGIPLTEDWLLKFGFVNLQKEADNNGGLVELIHNNVIGYRFAPEGAYGHPEIKYVHQLQNLYYALTQTELTLTK